MSTKHRRPQSQSFRRHASILAVFAALLVSCDTIALQGLSEDQANEAIAALHDARINASKEAQRGRYGIRVDRGKLPQALKVLQGLGIPHPDRPGLKDYAKTGSLLPSRQRERANYEAAVAGELEQTLEALPGVRRARIHIGSPEPSFFGPQSPLEASGTRQASVLLLGDPEDQEVDAQARELVAGAVPNLPANSIRLVRAPYHLPAHRDTEAVASPWWRPPFLASLLVNMILAGLLLFLVYRRRSAPSR